VPQEQVKIRRAGLVRSTRSLETLPRKPKKTMTEKQLAANRRNAKLSTGPKTERGKLMSSKNAERHGLLSKKVVRGLEEPEEVKARTQELIEFLQPDNPLLWEMAEQIAHYARQGRRGAGLEAEFFKYIRGDKFGKYNARYGDLTLDQLSRYTTGACNNFSRSVERYLREKERFHTVTASNASSADSMKPRAVDSPAGMKIAASS